MTAPDGRAVESLRARLQSFTILGSTSLGPDELSSMCAALVERLRPVQGRRVALTSQRAEHVLAGLAAAQAAGCEILLSRSETIPAESLAKWDIAALIDSSLTVSPTAEPETVEEGRFAILIATSGTTGEPKLASHAIDGLLGRIRLSTSAAARPRWLLTYHPAAFGGLQVLLTALAAGGELITVYPPSVAALAEQALVHQPTHISGTPTFWRAFLMCLGPRAADLRLSQITLGGEIADEAILARLGSAFPGTKVSHIYASTEAGALFSVQDGRAGFPATWLETGVDGVSLRIYDGVLEVRSPRAMQRYLNQDSATVLRPDGWLVTGDMVELVGDRVLFRGRQGALLNVGGAKVRPEEVEARLIGIPGVVDASVYGVPNPLTGAVLGADIVLEEGLEESQARSSIMTRLRQDLESYKVPRVLRFVDAIDASAAGKKERRA